MTARTPLALGVWPLDDFSRQFVPVNDDTKPSLDLIDRVQDGLDAHKARIGRSNKRRPAQRYRVRTRITLTVDAIDPAMARAAAALQLGLDDLPADTTVEPLS